MRLSWDISGIRVVPVQRSTSGTDVFQFINTTIDADEPKSAMIRELGRELQRARVTKAKIAIVAGPAIVRTGAGDHLVRLIESRYVDRLFAGNAFAVYDVERALFGTSLGSESRSCLCTEAATRTICVRLIRSARRAESPRRCRKRY